MDTNASHKPPTLGSESESQAKTNDYPQFCKYKKHVQSTYLFRPAAKRFSSIASFIWIQPWSNKCVDCV